MLRGQPNRHGASQICLEVYILYDSKFCHVTILTITRVFRMDTNGHEQKVEHFQVDQDHIHDYLSALKLTREWLMHSFPSGIF